MVVPVVSPRCLLAQLEGPKLRSVDGAILTTLKEEATPAISCLDHVGIMTSFIALEIRFMMNTILTGPNNFQDLDRSVIMILDFYRRLQAAARKLLSQASTAAK